MENPSGPTTPRKSRGSEGPSEPVGLNERNQPEFEILQAGARRPGGELDGGANDTEANDSDSSFGDPDIRSRRPDVYNGDVPSSVYTPWVRSGEVVQGPIHRGPDGRPTMSEVSQLYRRRTIFYPRRLFTGRRGVKRGIVTEHITRTVMRQGGFFSMVRIIKTQPYYDKRNIYFLQEGTFISYWRRNRSGSTPPPGEVRRVTIPALPMSRA
ncbi:hypothetical protein V8C40DRAFT_203142 [Trichoderma camerunense]